MGNLAIANNAVGELGEIQKSLKKIISGYLALPEIFAAEYRAIEDHNVADLETSCQKKIRLTDDIERATLRYRELVLGLIGPSLDLNFDFDGKKHFEVCENYIAQIMRENRNDHVVHGMLAYQMRVYRQSWSELKEVLEKTVPQINQNKVIIEKILHNHQESHKFWLKIW